MYQHKRVYLHCIVQIEVDEDIHVSKTLSYLYMCIHLYMRRYSLMELCWTLDRQQRPEFSEMIKRLNDEIQTYEVCRSYVDCILEPILGVDLLHWCQLQHAFFTQ